MLSEGADQSLKNIGHSTDEGVITFKKGSKRGLDPYRGSRARVELTLPSEIKEECEKQNINISATVTDFLEILTNKNNDPFEVQLRAAIQKESEANKLFAQAKATRLHIERLIEQRDKEEEELHVIDKGAALLFGWLIREYTDRGKLVDKYGQGMTKLPHDPGDIDKHPNSLLNVGIAFDFNFFNQNFAENVFEVLGGTLDYTELIAKYGIKVLNKDARRIREAIRIARIKMGIDGDPKPKEEI